MLIDSISTSFLWKSLPFIFFMHTFEKSCVIEEASSHISLRTNASPNGWPYYVDPTDWVLWVALNGDCLVWEFAHAILSLAFCKNLCFIRFFQFHWTRERLQGLLSLNFNALPSAYWTRCPLVAPSTLNISCPVSEGPTLPTCPSYLCPLIDVFQFVNKLSILGPLNSSVAIAKLPPLSSSNVSLGNPHLWRKILTFLSL